MKLLIQYPAIYFTPMFTPFMFGPVTFQSAQPCDYKSCLVAGFNKLTCFSSCSCGNKKMHFSFLHTYFNILLAGIGSYLALLYFDKNLFPLSFKDTNLAFLAFPIHEYVYISLPVCFLTIIVFHLLETKNSCCCKICLPFTKREELSFSQEEHLEDDIGMKAQSQSTSPVLPLTTSVWFIHT